MHLLLEGIKDYALFLLDPQGRVVSWNRGAEQLFGYRAAEIVGRHCSRFFTPESIRRGKPEEELRQVEAQGQAEKEAWYVRKDGTRFWASAVMTALRAEDGSLQGFARVLRDITDRKQLEEELRRQAEELAEANRRKDQFLAMLSHELRNPLAPVLNAVLILRRLAVQHPALEQAGVLIERQVKHLARLIDDLLEVTRVTRGRIALHREPLELGAALRRSAESVRPLMEEHRHTFTLALSDEPVWLEADPTRLDQIVVNLLDNAAKYTDPGGRVELSAGREDGQAVLRVCDNGMGIAADMLSRLFDLFAQADQSLDRARGGLGIGLTLVRSLVELHGGSVRAHSAGPEKGSTFEVRLPTLAAAPAPDGRERPPAYTRRPLRMLVVDDNRDTAASMAMLLRLHGHEVVEAHAGPEALERAREWRPEVVLLDIGLPRMDGYEVARRLRQLPGEARPLLVAVTGYGQDSDRQRSHEAGFDHHLVKPVDLETLEDLLARLRWQRPGTRGETVCAGDGRSERAATPGGVPA